MSVISPLPTPPSRSDPANFAARGDALLGALPTFVTETNTVASEVNTNASNAATSAATATTNASQAATSAAAALQSVADAAAVSGATQWISGTTYAIGKVVWSPLSYLNYRRKTAGAGATDPSLDSTNWALMGTPTALPFVLISTDTTAVTSSHYIFTANLTLTLPASPTLNSAVEYTDLSGLTTCLIDPGTEKIRGTTGAMALNTKNTSRRLVYTGSTKGWV